MVEGHGRRYSAEFRRQAVKVAIETGRPLRHVASDLGISHQLLGYWIAAARRAGELPPAGRVTVDPERMLTVDERAELEQLRRENAELRSDRDFLEKASAFFAGNLRRM